jgi:TatD DNase family protein
MRLFDTHAHVDQDDFDKDRDAVLERARLAGVETIVAVGVTAESSQRVIELAAEYDLLLPAVGIQPNYCGEVAEGDWQRILELAVLPQVVALGETGLDRYWDRAPFDAQQDYFDRHLRLSQQLDLPFIVHTRNSDAEVLAMLREARQRGPVRGVMHSFTGSVETASECVELGMHISFAGMVTFKKSDDLRAVAATVPLDRLLIETDSPYLAPQPKRGKRNEPSYVLHTAECLAEVRGLSVESFGHETTANAWALFKRR